MKFGTRAGDSTRRQGTSSGNEDWLRYFRQPETRLRFLEEMNDWTEVWMHWSPGKQRTYPCTDDFDTCPGHNSDNERERQAQKRYIVNALSDGYVNAWIIPGSLWDDLDRFKDKSGGTITDRDYTIVKKGSKEEGVRYSADREERDRIDLSKYDAKKRDHQQMLNDVFVEVWGKKPEDFENGTPEAHEVKRVAKRAVTPPSWSENGTKTEEAYQDPPSEPQPQSDGEAEEDQVLSEAELRSMSAEQIKALFVQCGLEVPDLDDSQELADELMAKLS